MPDSLETQVAVVVSTVQRMEADIRKIDSKLDSIDADHAKEFVSRAEFLPVQKLVYGLVGTVMLSVVGAVLGLVLVK